MQDTAARILDDSYNPTSVLRSPGVYVAASDSLAFGFLYGLRELGTGNFLGRCYLEDGREAIAVEVGAAKRNATAGTVKIGPEFFSKAIDEYDDWRTAWWREAIQNAVDAGARNVICQTVDLDEHGKLTSDYEARKYVDVICDDDGSGMTEDIVLNKFLILRGSGKAGDSGAAGGFGKAKELLLFGWVSWQIHTRDAIYEGHGADYTYGPAPMRKGTRITVRMTASRFAPASRAIDVIKKSHLPKVSFVVDGESYKADLKVGRSVRMIGDDKIEVFYSKTTPFDRPSVLVRDRSGLFMFSIRAPTDLPGVVVLNLRAPSIEMLTSNRDGLVSTYRYAVEDYVNELAADVKSAIKKKTNIFKKSYKGAGKFSGEDPAAIRARVAMSLGRMEPGDKRRLALSKEQIQAIMSGMDAAGATQEADDESPWKGSGTEYVGGAGGGPPITGGTQYVSGSNLTAPRTNKNVGLDLRAIRSVLGEMLSVPMADAAHVENAIRQATWEPDFYIVNELEDFRPGVKFEPDGMTPTLRKIARFWAELVRFVLIQVGSDAKYGVGWHFGFDAYEESYPGASFLEDDDGNFWVLLNPFAKGDPKTSKLWNLNEPKDVNMLYAMAIHECVHLNAKHARHNESFASTFTEYVAKTANRGRTIENTRRAVLARGAATGGMGAL